MNNYREYILNQIRLGIPMEILTRAFPIEGNGMHTLEERIYQEVIIEKVLVDMDLLGGQEFNIELDGVPYIQKENTLIYKVPLEKTNGKIILNAISIMLPDDMSGRGGLYGAVYGPSATMSTNVRLVGVNCIEVKENISRTNLFLKCRIGHEPNFANWESASMPHIAELALLAAKMLCYTKLTIAIGDGAVNGGSVNSYLRQAIDEMSDAREMYSEKMRVDMRKVILFQDKDVRKRIVDMVVPTMF